MRLLEDIEHIRKYMYDEIIYLNVQDIIIRSIWEYVLNMLKTLIYNKYINIIYCIHGKYEIISRTMSVIF